VSSDLPLPSPDGPRARARRRVTRADEGSPLDWPPSPEDLALIEVVDTSTFSVVPCSETSAKKAGDLDLLRRCQPERLPPSTTSSLPAQLRASFSPVLASLLTAAGISAIAFSVYLSFSGPRRALAIEEPSTALNGDVSSLPVAPAFKPQPLAPVAQPQDVASTVGGTSASALTRQAEQTEQSASLSQTRSTRAARSGETTQIALKRPERPESKAEPQRNSRIQPHELHWLKPSLVVAKAEPTKNVTPSAPASVATTSVAPAPATPSPAPTPVATPAALTADVRAGRDLPAMTPLATTPPSAAVRTAVVSETVDSPEQQGVRAALKQYEQAYERLDANAVRAVWPSVDARALARAFHDLKSQALVFDRCNVSLDTAHAASAECRGRATYETRAGEQSARTEHLEWTFQLEKNNEAWRIVKASAR